MFEISSSILSRQLHLTAECLNYNFSTTNQVITQSGLSLNNKYFFNSSFINYLVNINTNCISDTRINRIKVSNNIKETNIAKWRV